MISPKFSIVIAAKDEAESLADTVAEIAEVLAGQEFEIVIVDDGSADGTPQVIRDLVRRYGFIRHLVHAQNCGKSAAILTGVRAAQAPLVVTMDGDGQNDPRFVLPLLAPLAEAGVGVVAGQRIRHAHSGLKRIGSKLANGLRAFMLKDATRDTACGLKAFPREVFLRFPYFDTMHRYLPALALREGLQVRHIDVTDRPRLHGQSKYGLIDRALVGIVDLFGARWLISRRRRVPEAREIFLDKR